MTEFEKLILTKLVSMEETLRILRVEQHDIRRHMKRNYEKMMDGFKCIEKSFKLNCSKQIEFNELMEDMTELTGILKV